jgi:carboxylesterase type B
MTGVNKDEGAMNIVPNWKHMEPEDNQLAENWGFIGAQQLFLLPKKSITFEEELTARMVAQFYVGKDGINRENKQGLMDMFTDAYFAYPNTEAVKLHTKAAAPIYNYLLSYRGSASFAPLFAMGDPVAAQQDFGVAHADDLMYLFRVAFGNFSTLNTENDEKFVEIWQQLVVNFARYGNPTPVGLSNIPIWPKAQNSRAACVYLDVGLEPKEKHRMFAERMQFWNKLFFSDLLEKYAISEQDNELLAEIDTVIVESEEDETKEEDDDDAHKHKGKNGKHKRKGNGRRNMKNKRFRKQKRLAKKLKQLKCN